MSIAVGVGIGVSFQTNTGSGQGMTLANASGTYAWSGTYNGAAFSGAETLGAGSSLALYFSNYALLTALDVSDNSLTQASVDSILAKLVAGGGEDGTLDLSGNSLPSSNTNINILYTRGWTIAGVYVPDAITAVVEWWDFRTGGTGAAITSHAGEKGVYTLSQSNASYKPIWNASGYCAWDATDDYLEFTLSTGIAAGQLWIETPYGWCKSGIGNYTATTHRLALPDATRILLVDTATLSGGDATALAAWMTGTQYGFICKTNSLTITNVVTNPYVSGWNIDYFGGNSVEYSKISSSSGETVDLSAQGLTAPVHVRWPVALNSDSRTTTLKFQINACVGCVIDYSNIISILDVRFRSNKLCTIFPKVISLTSLSGIYMYENDLTGNIPSLATNTSLANFYCYSNQLTDWDGGTVSNTISNFRAESNALSETAVNGLLVAFDTAGRASGTLNLSGGTNSAPTGAGATAKASLTAKGWAVTTN